MSGVSRRVFLKGGSAAVVAAGLSLRSPTPAVVGLVDTQGPADVGATEAAVSDAEASAFTSEPLVAHVRDLATGEIGLFSGTRELPC